MAIRQIQSTFTLGELDPKLVARSDFEGYYKGAKKLRNVCVIPQGGVTRRFGTKFITTILDTADSTPLTDPNEVNGLVFDFSPTKTFVVIARAHDKAGTPKVAFDIYLNNVLQTTVTTTDYTVAQIPDLYFLRSQDRVIVLHEAVQPHQLVRGTNDTSWTLSAINFSHYPVYDFSLTDGVSYRGATDSFTASATSGTAITVTSVNAVFKAHHVGGIFIGAGGIFRITAVNNLGTIATGNTIVDFNSTTIKGVDAILKSAAWGDYTGGTPAGENRGWPSKGCFFQNRLVLANSLALPNLVWFSNIGDVYNFDDSEATAIDGFSIGVGTDGNEEVKDVVGTKAIVVLGLQGVYAFSLFIDTPISPSNAFLTEQARNGAATRKAHVVDNQIFYIDANTQQVNAVQYDIGTSSFNVLDATLLSPQVVDDPVSTAVFRPTNNNGIYYLTNNANGTLAVFQSLINQNVQAWTLSDTRGTFERVMASKENGYVIAQRMLSTGTTANGFATNYFTANSDFEGFTDIRASAISTSTDASLFVNEGDYLLIGNDIPFSKITVAFNTAASVSISPTFEYLDKSGTWNIYTPTDSTSGFTTGGSITWTPSTDTPYWGPYSLTDDLPLDTVSGIDEKFWIRIKRTAATVATPPIEDTIKLNVDNRLHLEQLSFDVYTDDSKITTSDSDGLVTGLDHLKGQQVYAVVNGTPQGPFFVDTSGEITVNTVSSTVTVGINYIPEIVPMPMVAQGAFMASVYQPKHLKAIYVDYYESLGITVNGKEIATIQLGTTVLDEKPKPKTGFAEITPMRGWDPRGVNTISQELPLPFTLLGIGYELEAS